MPLSPGSVVPRDMDARQWDRFVAQAGIQADSKTRNFTPTVWGGFSVDPTDDISYMDFGAIVMMWTDTPLTGTSDDTSMLFSGGMPEAVRPRADRYVRCIVTDDSSPIAGVAVVKPNGSISFLVEDPTAFAGQIGLTSIGFTNTGVKGLPSGWLITYPK